MKVVVSWSGGKDSQAALIHSVEKYGKKHVEAVFCDTGWEHPDTYRHVHAIAEQMQIPLTVLKSDKYKDFVDLARKKTSLPKHTNTFLHG